MVHLPLYLLGEKGICQGVGNALMLLGFVVLLWARSRVDNAPASGAGDRGFESHRARLSFYDPAVACHKVFRFFIHSCGWCGSRVVEVQRSEHYLY
jgi:hypothetical protein